MRIHPQGHKYLSELDDEMKKGEVFKPVFAKKIWKATELLFEDMCEETGAASNDGLQHGKLNSRGITKDRLCVWLEAACCLLDQYCNPVLEAASVLSDKLKEEKIRDQESIIELQQKLIQKKDEELGAVKSTVQSTVQTELKSYSSVLKTTCSRALGPRRMQAAMKSVAEAEDRSKNLIVYGLAEQKNENLESKVLQVLEHLDEKPRIVSCCRLGKDTADGGPAVKPVKFVLAGTDHVRQILSKTRRLREVEGYTSVYISPDRSVESRVAHRALVVEMKTKRTDEPNKVHSIRNNRVVSLEKG